MAKFHGTNWTFKLFFGFVNLNNKRKMSNVSFRKVIVLPTKKRLFPSTYPHMNLNICYFSLANPTFIILYTSMNFSIMFEHFGQGIKPQRTIWALVIFGVGSVTFSVTFHPFGFSGPKGTSPHLTIHPLIIWGFKTEVCH